MYVNTAGLILRETAYRDSSKILTVLTGSEGKLTVTARGALRRNSKLAAVTQLLAFSEMTLVSARDRWTLTEARSIEQFIGLRSDIALLSLASYFAELTEAVADEDCPNPELLPLILNSLFALSEGVKSPEYVKPVFELRLMRVSGLAPNVDRCAVCGRTSPERVHLDVSGGTIRCDACAPGGSDAFSGGAPSGRDAFSNGAPSGSSAFSGGAPAGSDAFSGGAPSGSCVLSGGVLGAMRYIIGCDPKKLFSFTLGETALRELLCVTEGYLLAHLDRRFRTLDFYRSII